MQTSNTSKMPEIESEPKEPKHVSNRGFIVDLIFNFPQGVAVDKESYINEIIEHVQQAFNAGKTQKEDFTNWLKQPKLIPTNEQPTPTN